MNPRLMTKAGGLYGCHEELVWNHGEKPRKALVRLKFPWKEKAVLIETGREILQGHDGKPYVNIKTEWVDCAEEMPREKQYILGDTE